ncbi:hypothetical protein FEM48_Zijuj02G0033700 [Ziziphus jujuba var. spinosa]|uniref:Protein saal1 n=1 Tax=Ziziphus jujuba var. spinosa TaxID=714518 RepID=A0A978VTB8_ZIZJJ|nr:hypothetical protein FEM48_Zijuj02G0033700 [Ziziphus jujuba var. spinosa]
MAVDPKSILFQDEEEQEQEVENHDPPAHNPYAPPDELFDITTTVDPSYVISLIRKLLPTDATATHKLHDNGACGVHTQGSNIDKMEENESTDSHWCSSRDVSGRMEIVDVHKSAPGERESEDPYNGVEHTGHDVYAGEEVWEEYGCILWDLAASKTHAELMVENLILEVLKANLMVSQSVRAKEISLGIMGNLACHEVLMKRIVSTDGLVELIGDQLFLDDAQCLCEVCRLLTSGIQSSECSTWATALQSERILCRILWIAENSLNPRLIEKSVEILLAIIESSQEVVHSLLPTLMTLGLPSLLTNLLGFEIRTLMSERVSERFLILDVILRAVEALSVIDGYSQDISSNKELFQLVLDLVKLPDKVEVASSCVTAAVLIANILSDVANLATELLYDLNFLRGLLDIFPLASDDREARSAIWNIMARLLFQIQESEVSPSTLSQYVLVLASKCDLIEDDLLDNQLDGLQANARTTAVSSFLRRICSILSQWTETNDGAGNNHATGEDHTNGVDIVLSGLPPPKGSDENA